MGHSHAIVTIFVLLACKALNHSHALGVLGNTTYHVFKKGQKTSISKKNLDGNRFSHSHAVVPVWC